MSEVDDALVATLVDMGFESELAATALLITENDLSQALDWLAENSGDVAPPPSQLKSSSSKKERNGKKSGNSSSNKSSTSSTPSKSIKQASTTNPVSTSISAYSPGHNSQYSPGFSSSYSPSPIPASVHASTVNTTYSPSQITSQIKSNPLPQPINEIAPVRLDSPEIIALLADITSLDQKFKGLYQRRIDLDQKRDNFRRIVHPHRSPSPPSKTPHDFTPELIPGFGNQSPSSPTKKMSLSNSQNQQHQVFNEKFQRLREMSKSAHDLASLTGERAESALRSSAKQIERPPVDLTPTAPINEREIKKIDAQFENHLKSHPHDASDILFGHFQMILCLPNHPVTQRSKCVPSSALIFHFIDWSKSWFSPYARIETPTPRQVKAVADLIPQRIQSLGDIIVGYYTFIKKKPELVEKISEAIFDIIWSYVYPDFFSLVRKANRQDDQAYAAAVMSLQTVSITKFDVRPQYHLSNESQPYQSAINTIKSLPRAVTATEKLAILRAAAAKIVNCVVEYWKRQPLPEGQKRPETSVGGDELLPLMTYVIIRARLPNLFSECAFMEMLITDKQAIEQEGYVLATLQTSLSLILAMSEEHLRQQAQQSSLPTLEQPVEV